MRRPLDGEVKVEKVVPLAWALRRESERLTHSGESQP